MALMLFASLGFASAQDIDPPRAGPVERVEHLLGAWRLVEMGGEVMPPGAEMRLEFMEGGQLRVVAPQQPPQMGTYALVAVGRLAISTADGDDVEMAAVLDAAGRLMLEMAEGEMSMTMVLTRVGPPPR